MFGELIDCSAPKLGTQLRYDRDLIEGSRDGTVSRPKTLPVELPPPPPGAQPLVPHTPARGSELTPEDRELWFTSMVDDGVSDYDIVTKKPSQKIATRKAPHWLTFSPDGK